MEDRFVALESEVRSLAQQLHALEARLAALESAPVPRAAAADGAAATAHDRPAAAVARLAERADTIGSLSLAGRLLIVVGGAYLLRALTDSAVLSPLLGVSLGLAYALFWGVVAGREAGRARWWSAAAHGLAAVVTAYPVLWEAVTRFRLLAQPWDAVLLAVLTALLLTVACRSTFQPLAWMTTLGALATAIGLLVATGVVVPYAVFLIVLGVTTLWIGYELEWHGLRWVVALAANLAVAGLTVRALAPEPKDSVAAAMTVQLLLLSLYLVTIVVRTLVRARNVIPFEVVQMVACFGLGFAGAVYTTRATGYGAEMLGAAGLLLGVACYAAAFAFVDRRQGRGRNFYFYTSLALLFTLTGSNLLLDRPALGCAWALFAFLSGWLGYRFSRLALTIQSAIGLVAAAAVSGLAGHVATAFTASAGIAPAFPPWEALVVVVAAAVCSALPLPGQPEGGPGWIRIPRLVVTVVFLAGLGGVIVSSSAHVLSLQSESGADAGLVSTIRTIVLSLAAILLAWTGRHHRFAEWNWLVYPVLAVTGLKVLLQDLPQSRPATLFLALAVYGAALILSPRLRGRSVPPSK